jgi:hypothetical protein
VVKSFHRVRSCSPTHPPMGLMERERLNSLSALIFGIEENAADDTGERLVLVVGSR